MNQKNNNPTEQEVFDSFELFFLETLHCLDSCFKRDVLRGCKEHLYLEYARLLKDEEPARIQLINKHNPKYRDK